MDKAPSLSDLEYFLAVVSEGSLTRAAQQLRVQQSTLSVAVQRLERITGQSLLVRTRTGVEATPAGRKFLDRSRGVLERWYALTGDLRGEVPEVRTRLSLGCHQSTGLYALKRFLPKFLQDHPRAEVTVRHDYGFQTIENVLAYRLDFGLVVNPVPHEELEIRPLYPTYLALWGTERTRGASGDILFFDPEMYGLELMLARLERQKQWRFQRRLNMSSLDTIASLVVAGAGQAILPADTACSLGPSPLKLLWEPKGMPELRVSLIYRKDSQRTLVARKFIESVVGELGAVVPGKRHRAGA